MCGIAGYLEADARSEVWETNLGIMADAIRHRGPDDGGIWYDEHAGIGLANRRLAIVDLSEHGHQPMISASGRYVITFNGEIYNFEEVRSRVLADGYEEAFRGHSDTEVLLAAFDLWGVRDAIQRCVGMFGFAVWDKQEQSLTLGRDRMGEKPVYFGIVGNRLLFCSELKSIVSIPETNLTIDRDALALYFRHMYIPAPYSIYKGIAKLAPGSLITVTRENLRRRELPPVDTYWSAFEVARSRTDDPFTGDLNEAIDELERLLMQSVNGQMVADVPLGVLLSGGIDSSTVAALMQRSSTRPVKSFTIGSSIKNYDESVHARQIADHLGLDHTVLVVTPEETRSVISRLASMYDEPFSDQSQMPTAIVSSLARKSVTVALSGDGGDELFGGYSRHTWGPSVWRRIGGIPQGPRKLVGAALQSVSPKTWDSVFRTLSPVLPSRMRQRTPGHSIHKLAPLLASQSPSDLYSALVSYWDGSALVLGSRALVTQETDSSLVFDPSDLAAQMMLTDLITFLPDDVLTKVDRASMAASLETRAPLLDHRVVEFALSLPTSFHFSHDTGKQVLRGVLKRHVPEPLFDRPKAGFGVPVGTWLRGPLRTWADEMLDRDQLAADGYVRPDMVEKLWREHQSGKRNWTYQLWSVIVFQQWLHSDSNGHSESNCADSPAVELRP